MAISPNGQLLASPSEDKTVRVWNLKTGRQLRLLEHHESVICVAWSPDGYTLATALNQNVGLWDTRTGGRKAILEGAYRSIVGLAWSPDGTALAGCARQGITLWDTSDGRALLQLGPTQYSHQGIAWSPDGSRIAGVSNDGKHPGLWNAHSGEQLWKPVVEPGQGRCIAWSPDGKYIAAGFDDGTVRLWDSETGQRAYALEGHTADPASVSFLDGGRLLASLGRDGTLIFWRADAWTQVLRLDKLVDGGSLVNLAAHPTLSVVATPGSTRNQIKVWDVDLALLRAAGPATPTLFYVNAKAVLLGESGVGKSGLGIRLAEGHFRKTDSTHGAQFWHFSTATLPALPENVSAELTLWDLAGQPEYRLTNQLFLDDTDAALLLFDCANPHDPFRGVPYWAKVLTKQAPLHAKKFLVAARCDVSPVTVDRSQINQILAAYRLDEYFSTSAKTGEGAELILERLVGSIPWNTLPRTSTPKLFQEVRDILLEHKQAGLNLIAMQDVRHAASLRLIDRAVTQEEVDTVVRLLQSRGLAYRLDPRPELTFVLLKPERINQYGASIIQAARNHPQGIGAVSERNVLIGHLVFTGFDRLPQGEESLVLDATAELFISHDLAFREMGYLIFPSQINVTRQAPGGAHPRAEVAYRFSGSIERIYASLVVRLTYTDYFQREAQWKYAVEFSRGGHRLGFAMRQIEEGTGELEIYFDPGISEFDRVTFIRFVTDHLRTRGLDIQEHIHLYCPQCSREVTNREAIESRVRGGKLDIPCQFCDTSIVIPRSVEAIYRRDPSLGAKQDQLAETVQKRTAAEVEQFRADQQRMSAVNDHRICILHLSDLHLAEDSPADVYRAQLESDLVQELGIRRLDYLVVSGDVTNRSSEKEYDAAFMMIDTLVKRFGMDGSRVIVVPGNHDVNWDISEAAYPFVAMRKLPSQLAPGRHIPAGDAGTLVRDDSLYRKRFAHFDARFYRRVYGGQPYSGDYADQIVFAERPDDRILFVGLNSSWELDHHFRERASIHMPALSRALDRMQGGRHNGWLKIAVWHHPITGQNPMSDDFMQLLAVHKFQICLHGHIHEAIEGFHAYDDRRGIRIVGAGTFGAPTREQVTGIPLQYNVLTFDPTSGEIVVNSRKKEKADGAWSADARWGDKNNPKAWYRYVVPHYEPNPAGV